ncbi:unnamed protein product [Moneuplotes crassus]|uniref:Uncharacterized protein n=1 Tax=Euplotes crassus TaxID=5936 RepID=A0AAD1Y4X7_EUPCR|nr:unnamed protein product [Moneuplotes crassus]
MEQSKLGQGTPCENFQNKNGSKCGKQIDMRKDENKLSKIPIDCHKFTDSASRLPLSSNTCDKTRSVSVTPCPDTTIGRYFNTKICQTMRKLKVSSDVALSIATVLGKATSKVTNKKKFEGKCSYIVGKYQNQTFKPVFLDSQTATVPVLPMNLNKPVPDPKIFLHRIHKDKKKRQQREMKEQLKKKIKEFEYQEKLKQENDSLERSKIELVEQRRLKIGRERE